MIVIENTLSLSADQRNKMKWASQRYGLVVGVHLDYIKKDVHIEKK